MLKLKELPVWIISGLWKIVRFFDRILAPGFTAAVHW